VKPAPFEFVSPDSVEAVVEVLAGDPDAKVIAGGQSLVPLLALRLARPSVLVDVRRLGLEHVTAPDDDDDAPALTLGARVRHRTLERDPVVGEHAELLSLAAAHIGDAAIRNRGTLGGSLAHADPAAELPAALLALDGTVVVHGSAGRREIRAAELFEGFFVTALTDDDLITEVRIPTVENGRGSAFCEWAPRAGDFAVAGIALVLDVDAHGTCTGLGAAAAGVGAIPLDLRESFTSAGVVGSDAPVDSLLRAVARAVERDCAGDDDRAELAGLLAARAVRVAFERAHARAGRLDAGADSEAAA
jgi:aerobic carbon-monoxide dehydrogenase medium subunit